LLPKISQIIQDGSLGIVPPSPANVVAKLGVCSAGAANTVQQFSGPSVKVIKDALGTGPLAEAAAHSLEIAGGPVMTVPVNPSVPGAAGAVTHVGTGAAVLTVSGAPKDSYQVEVRVTRAATGLAAAAAAFVFSVDGGDTFSPEIAVPANGVYAVPNTGLTLTFSDGSFVKNDEYTFSCAAPSYTTTDLSTTIDALLADPRKFGCLHVVGAPAPSATAVTARGTSPLVRLSGSPAAWLDGVVLVTLAGPIGTGKFKLSIDGGATFGAEQALVASYVIPSSGLSLLFSPGTYNQGDSYTFNTYASIPALFAAVDTKMTSAENIYKYAFAVLEAPDAPDAILLKATANLASTRVMLAAGYCELTSSLSIVGGSTYKRSDAWPITARIAGAPIHEDLGRYRSGSLPGVVALYRDEYVTPGLASARFETLRTIPDAPGYYIASDTGGNMMAPLGSDYAFVQNRRVMDEACRVNRVAMLRYLNDDLLVDPKSGFILETEARRIEADVNAQLEADLVFGASRHASAVRTRVKRDENILSTHNLTTSVSVTPKSYAKTITTMIGFRNPAIAQAA
jgi:hypothetical protein